MAGKIGAALIESQQFFAVEVAAVGKSSIHGRAGMAFGTDKPVPTRLFGVGRVDIHRLKIQHGQQFHHGKTAADVAYAQMPDALQDITTDIQTDFLQIFAQFRFPLID